MPWVFLAIAIAFEVTGTSALKSSQGFTRLWPSALTVVSYVIAFYCLGLVLKSIPVGVAYAIWAGAGIAAIALIGLFVFGQRLDWAAVAGIALIIAGVIVINTLSGTVSH